jgi:hypothetical protein
MIRRAVLVMVVSLAAGACTTAFWARPGATRLELAQDTEACYRRAIEMPSPAAPPEMTAPAPGVTVDPPPPILWRRSPPEAAFVTFDQEQRYARCMRERGYRATRPPG